MSSPANLISDADRALYAESMNGGAMLRHMGARLSFPETEIVRMELTSLGPQHRGGAGTEAINGGVMAWCFDLALGSTSLLAPPLRRNATIEVSMRIERALRGDVLRCDAQIDRATTSILFSSALIFDEHGTVCARANGIVKLSTPIHIDDWAMKFRSETETQTQ